MIYVNGKGPQIVMNSILIWFKKKTNPYGENRWSVYTLSAYHWVERVFFSLFDFFFPPAADMYISLVKFYKQLSVINYVALLI